MSQAAVDACLVIAMDARCGATGGVGLAEHEAAAAAFEGPQLLLAALIKGVYMGAPSVLEARKVAQALVGTAWHAERANGRPAQAPSGGTDFEATLTALSRLAERSQKFKAEGAKAWLRSFGKAGSKLASRLGNQSKLRNGRTHGDDMFIDEVEALVRNAVAASGLDDVSEAATPSADEALEQVLERKGKDGTEIIAPLELVTEPENERSPEKMHYVAPGLRDCMDKANLGFDGARSLSFDIFDGSSDGLGDEDEIHGEDLSCAAQSETADAATTISEPTRATWQRLVEVSLASNQVATMKDLRASPASVSAMLSRASRRNDSCSSSRSSSSGDEDGEDLALLSFVDALTEIYTNDGLNKNGKLERIKRQKAVFAWARMASGDSKASASAEGKEIILGFAKATKEFKLEERKN